MKYVIVGYSVAAVNAITAIRESDKTGEITVISNEDRLYSRPLISYYLAGKLSKDKIGFTSTDFEKDMGVKVLYNTEAVKIETKSRHVEINNKKKLPYDRLLICSGGTPIKIPVDGLKDNLSGVFTFTKLADAKEIEKYIEKNKVKEAVILGGGLIGMKAAEALLGKKMKFKILDIADRLLANTFDREASAIIEEKLKENGCEFLKETTIKKVVSKAGKIEELVLSNGKKLKAKLLIMAVGVRPEVSLAKGTPIAVNRGIVVDARMETNVPGVFSAGDCAEGLEFLSGKGAVIAIWPTAAKQGKVAGHNMSGAKDVFGGSFAMNSVEILGVPSISFGITNPKEDGYEVVKKSGEGKYKKIVVKDNRLVGVILVNCIERAGIYGLLIKEKLDVLALKKELLTDDFGFLLLPTDFRKHFVTGEGTEV